MSSRLAIDAVGARGLERVLITGANGFIGRVLCTHLAAQGVKVTAVTRNTLTLPGAARIHAVGDFTAVRDWHKLLADNDAVVHLAALTHGGTRGATSARFRAINVDVSVRVAEAALACGIRRFVYLSSIKVNGESSTRDDGRMHAYTCSDPAMPEDDYGRSKLAAEQALQSAALASQTAIPVTPTGYIPPDAILANLRRYKAERNGTLIYQEIAAWCEDLAFRAEQMGQQVAVASLRLEAYVARHKPSLAKVSLR